MRSRGVEMEHSPSAVRVLMPVVGWVEVARQSFVINRHRRGEDDMALFWLESGRAVMCPLGSVLAVEYDIALAPNGTEPGLGLTTPELLGGVEGA